MPLQAQQIVGKALQIAKCPGYTTQGGDALNAVLQELAQTYDIEVVRKVATIQLSPGSGVGFPGRGSGPYILPTDYLRMWKDDIVYMVYNVPYKMVSIDLDAFDNLVQQPGISNFPEQYATDIGASATVNYGAPVLYCWPPSGVVATPQFRYWAQPPDILTPATSSQIPWFPNSNYLVTRVAGEMMKLTDDARTDTYLGEGPGGAQGILNRYLKLQTDDEGRAKTVTLDRRRFGKSFSHVAQTKQLGW
jgi:hypothetical protein